MRVALLCALVACTTGDDSVTTQASTVCGGGDVVHGIDVSSYETSIDWQAARSAGIEFAFVRVSDGLQYPDSRFSEYWQGARAAGVLRGAYQFFRPTQDPIAQADLLLGKLGPRLPGDLPPVIDVETTGGLAPADVEIAVRAWVDHVAAAIGRRPIIYAGYYSWQDYTGNANLTSSPLWHAQYTTAPCPKIPTPWTRWRFWQHTAEGTVPGVLGEPTDLDVFDGTRAELDAFADRAPPPCGTIAAAGGEIDDGDPCFAAGGPSATLRAVTDAGEGAGLVWTHATASQLPGNFATWTLELAEAGDYRIEVYTAGAYAQSRHARYQVRAAGALHELELDQTAGDGWQSLATLHFAAGGDQYVELDDNTGEGGDVQLVFDAIRLVRTDGKMDEPPPEAVADDTGCAAVEGGPASALLVLLLGRRRRPRYSAS